MNTQLITESPGWLIILCVWLALAYAAGMYYRHKRLSDIARWKVWLMAGLRFLVSFIIAVLLLSPLVKQIRRQVEKPILVIAQDNSRSMLLSGDSAWITQDYREQLTALSERFSTNFDVQHYTFGQEVNQRMTGDYQESYTDFTELFDNLESRLANRNVGALLLASDGIYNRGVNPVYAAEKANYPIYTLALGDTTVQADARISQLQTNRLAFLGNRFPVRLIVQADRMPEETLQVTIRHTGETVYDTTLTATQGRFSQELNTMLAASEKGIQQYSVQVSSPGQEQNTQNNSRSFVIEIIDSQYKVLLLAEGPHPDIGAFSQVLDQGRNYELTINWASQFSGSLNEYHLLILHQLPNDRYPLSNLMEQAQNLELPVLFVMGPETRAATINSHIPALTLKQNRPTTEQAFAELNTQFGLFQLEGEFPDVLADMPPLEVPFGQYQVRADAQVLAYQKIKGITTQKPLIAFGTRDYIKYGFISGTGLWRWRLYSYRIAETQQPFEEFLNRIIQYLAIQNPKENLVIQQKGIFPENEPVILDAQVYNESYQAVADAVVTAELTNKAGETFSFDMLLSETGDQPRYTLNAGTWPKGRYPYTIEARIGEKTYTHQGVITVLPVEIEALQTTANHHLLYRLARQHGGELFTVDQMDELAKAIQDNPGIRARVHTTETLRDVIYLKGLFFALLLLLTLEWALRKWEGTY